MFILLYLIYNGNKVKVFTTTLELVIFNILIDIIKYLWLDYSPYLKIDNNLALDQIDLN